MMRSILVFFIGLLACVYGVMADEQMLVMLGGAMMGLPFFMYDAPGQQGAVERSHLTDEDQVWVQRHMTLCE